MIHQPRWLAWARLAPAPATAAPMIATPRVPPTCRLVEAMAAATPAWLSGIPETAVFVIGEFTMASLLNRPAFGPYLQLIGANRAYEPSALAIIAFLVTWACMGLINVVGSARQTKRA